MTATKGMIKFLGIYKIKSEAEGVFAAADAERRAKESNKRAKK